MRLVGLGHDEPQPCIGAAHCRFVRTELRLLGALGAARRGPGGWEPTLRGRLWLTLLMGELLGAGAEPGDFRPIPGATARPGRRGAEALAAETGVNVAL
jgi:hypothetical protein